MPSEWLGVHGGRSYGPSPRGKSLPGPAVVQLYGTLTLTLPYSNMWYGLTLIKLKISIKYRLSIPSVYSINLHELSWCPLSGGEGHNYMTVGDYVSCSRPVRGAQAQIS